MSHWHYQLMKHNIGIEGEEYYALHEYYPMDEGAGWTQSPVFVEGDSVDDIKKSLMLMLEDIDKHGVKVYD